MDRKKSAARLRPSAAREGESESDAGAPGAVSATPMKERRKVYTAMPVLEGTLSFLMVCATGLAFSVCASKGWEDLALLVGCLFASEAVVYLSRRFWWWFGTFLSETAFSLGMVDKPPLSSDVSMTKWLEQSWQLTVHFLGGMSESFLLFVAPALFNDPRLPPMWETEDMVNIWTPRPWVEGGQPQHPIVRIVYIAQLAIWIYTAGMHVFFDQRRKDYQVMLSHHVVTVFLIAGSYAFGYVRIGLLILYVNDMTDIFIDWLKMCNYLKLRGARALFLVEGSFTLVIVTYAYWRLYHTPFRVNYSAGTGWRTEPEDMETIPPDFLVAAGFLVALLWVLTALHSWWFYLFLRILFKLVTESAEEASRSEYEGDSDEESDAEPESYLFFSSAKRLLGTLNHQKEA